MHWTKSKIEKGTTPTIRHLCPKCQEEKYYILTVVRNYFLLFSFPIFRYKIEYFLHCPTCEYGSLLNSEKAEKIRGLSKINNRFLSGEIVEEEYIEQIKNLSDLK
ncbi:MAG: hypothetical protein AAB917_01315 [Patescibacteria group bacterium]